MPIRFNRECPYCGIRGHRKFKLILADGRVSERCGACDNVTNWPVCKGCNLRYKYIYYPALFGTNCGMKWPEINHLCCNCGTKHVETHPPKMLGTCTCCTEVALLEELTGGICKECIERYTQCTHCRKNMVLRGQFIAVEDRLLNKPTLHYEICPTCVAKVRHECDMCGRFILNSPNGLCSVCEGFAIPCELCGDWADNRYDTVQGKYLCKQCHNRRVGHCGVCDKTAIDVGMMYHHHFDDEGENGYACRACKGSPIMGYNYKPKPQFNGKGVLYYGVENEYDFTMETYKKYTDQLRMFYKDRANYYLVHDGSLNNGVELVFHPMTFDYITKETPKFCPSVPNFAGTTAGCHIHMTKDAFTTFHLFKFIKFLTTYNTEMFPIYQRKIGHTNPKNGKDYCRTLPYSSSSIAKSRTGDDKYWWINLASEHTIEIRLFKAVSTDDELMAIIQSLDCLYYYTKDTSLDKLSFEGYKSALKQKKYRLASKVFNSNSVIL